MIHKVLLMLCSFALVRAGIIATDGVTYSSISTPVVKTIPSHVVEKTVTSPIAYTRIIQPPPAYHSIVSTKESNYESPDGTQHITFTKSSDTGYASVKKYESSNNVGASNFIPSIYSSASHSPAVYHQEPAYELSSPLVSKTVSVPVSYSTHEVPLTKTVVSPPLSSYSTLDNTKFTSSGLSSYSSNPPGVESQPLKTTITYSEAPLVSHMSFTGLGASYAW
ncbi:larval/pupal cuticle protein H1C-like [Spodoptera litura]|uniref:Larval/pupal cuticle protein H1C-like n=1 Tax=Spodoptera litura TaxID=69820 RepID=A0A9J7EBT9_SPOLT|nr:larval/pupal cuticle protein H1C-like [Spodoptera litura]